VRLFSDFGRLIRSRWRSLFAIERAIVGQVRRRESVLKPSPVDCPSLVSRGDCFSRSRRRRGSHCNQTDLPRLHSRGVSGIPEIPERLNSDGIPSPAGKQWRAVSGPLASFSQYNGRTGIRRLARSARPFPRQSPCRNRHISSVRKLAGPAELRS